MQAEQGCECPDHVYRVGAIAQNSQCGTAACQDRQQRQRCHRQPAALQPLLQVLRQLFGPGELSGSQQQAFGQVGRPLERHTHGVTIIEQSPVRLAQPDGFGQP